MAATTTTKKKRYSQLFWFWLGKCLLHLLFVVSWWQLPVFVVLFSSFLYDTVYKIMASMGFSQHNMMVNGWWTAGARHRLKLQDSEGGEEWGGGADRVHQSFINVSRTPNGQFLMNKTPQWDIKERSKLSTVVTLFTSGGDCGKNTRQQEVPD